jgi:ABC-type Fe3+/spermidine/putrescine transport system ATPase subunit/nucleotide-binding universal stress UspA family protein
LSIVLSGLTKRFGETRVVNRVSLEIGEGELFVLLGGSGSGKSTILRLIAGLAEEDAGKIEINGRDVSALPSQERGTGFVFQNYSIFRHMTAAENVEFGLRIRRVPAEERRRRSEELLELVGLTGLGGRYPLQLSGGQQQRVALARALAYRPEVLLLDEPFGALDVKIRAQLRESLKQIQRELRVTTILVTHDQEEAFELAHRIGLLDRGFLIEVGAPEELYHHPRTEFAATFIGGGNVLVGRRREGGIHLGSAVLPIPPGGLPHDLDAPVRVLFRPETVHLRDEPPAADSELIPLGTGRVVSRTFTGPVSRIRLEMEGLRGVLPLVPAPAYGQHAAQIDAIVHSGRQIEHGQLLWVGLSGFHTLDPTALKVLVCGDPKPGGRAACDFGFRLAKAASGPVALLGVAPGPGEVPSVRAEIDAMARSSGLVDGRLRTVVRQGPVPDQILGEARDGSYEVVVLGRGMGEEESAGGTGPTARQILARTDVPVLLVSGAHEGVRRMLVCIAAGEPSKTVVRFGARVARHTKAEVRVIHVLDPGASAEVRARAQTYLDRAVASLDSFGVRGESKLLEGLPLESILQEAEREDADLLVIGAPLPNRRQALVRSDLPGYLVAGTRRPVAIVPMPR